MQTMMASFPLGRMGMLGVPEEAIDAFLAEVGSA